MEQKNLFNYLLLPKNSQLKQKASQLRKAGVLSEVLFWQTFKDKKNLGWDIDRQVIIDNYIVDFFIPELGLVFEIDGQSHNLKGKYDVVRDSHLNSLGLMVVHLEDKLIRKQMGDVCSIVQEAIKRRMIELKSSTPSASPPPLKRGIKI